MCHYFVTNVQVNNKEVASIVKNPLFRGDFTWRGYKQEVNLEKWKWGTRPIYRFNKSDTLRHRGIRYQQFDTRRETTKKYVYLNRVEGQIYREYSADEIEEWESLLRQLEEVKRQRELEEQEAAAAKLAAAIKEDVADGDEEEEYDDDEEYEEDEEDGDDQEPEEGTES